ncbi:MarR family transcriptional regulator [Tropicibacter sp. S64]|uniref:MarR family transcriptional regulator n=1 Tax=Tropicibacter sp. S64 TaxID=3415122 RepID=UPI003C7AD23E
MARKPQLPPIGRSLPIAMMRARETVMAPIRATLSASGITEPQWRILRVLAEDGPSDATHVSDRACLLLPSLIRIARSMADRELIHMAHDPLDRRRQVLDLGYEGTLLLAANASAVADIVEGYKARLGNEDYELLLDLLAVLGDPPGTS